ncbi:MAG TPA: hypothetical protein VGG88_12725 [Gaiellaceae bacterium]
MLAPGIVLAAVAADLGGVHGLAFWLVLAAVPAAAASAFAGLGAALAGDGGWLRANTATIALVLLVTGSAVRESAPQGAAVPALAVSTLVIALLCYALPGIAWLLSEPLRSVRTAAPRPRASRA